MGSGEARWKGTWSKMFMVQTLARGMEGAHGRILSTFVVFAIFHKKLLGEKRCWRK